MNGVTREMDDSFEPTTASSPLIPRRYPHHSLSYYQPQVEMHRQPLEMRRQPMPEPMTVQNGYKQSNLPKKRFKPNKKSLNDVSRKHFCSKFFKKNSRTQI